MPNDGSPARPIWRSPVLSGFPSSPASTINLFEEMWDVGEVPVRPICKSCANSLAMVARLGVRAGGDDALGGLLRVALTDPLRGFCCGKLSVLIPRWSEAADLGEGDWGGLAIADTVFSHCYADCSRIKKRKRKQHVMMYINCRIKKRKRKQHVMMYINCNIYILYILCTKCYHVKCMVSTSWYIILSSSTHTWTHTCTHSRTHINASTQSHTHTYTS